MSRRANDNQFGRTAGGTNNGSFDSDYNDNYRAQDPGSSNPFLDESELNGLFNSGKNSATSLLHQDSTSDSVPSSGYNNSNPSAQLLHPSNNNTNSNKNLNNQPVSDYKGYYARNNNNNSSNSGNIQGRSPNGAGLRVPSTISQQQPNHGFPSSTSMASNLIATSDIMSPPAFDRYPQVGNSRTVSMHAGGTPLQGSSSGNNSNSSINSSNPFLSDQDFSPFGGYPASSFPLKMDEKEDDDYLHNPDLEEDLRLDKKRFELDLKNMDKRSAGGLIGILLLFLGAIAVFIILPVVTFTGAGRHGSAEVTELLTLYEYPQLSAIRTSLVDPDTPSSAKTVKSLSGDTWELVFSDEFNAEGRTFFDNEDQFWTAPNFHYDATKDLDWYSPQQVITSEGTLKLRMDAYKNNDLYYRSGMLQSWNKLCFTQGRLEISVNLPNYGTISGLWPGAWTLGNLGRPGYQATTEGVWPYSYEACDAGITPNQSSPDGISYLPGQKLSACTCDGEDHPNLGVGRGAPEIDIIEIETDTSLHGTGVGVASQSYQVAPFDIWYIPDYDFVEIYNESITSMNTYCGGPFQQAVSAVSTLNASWYEFGQTAGHYQKYAIEYLHDNDDGYIRWHVGDNPTFTVFATALHPNGNIDWRRISKEPMSIILNLGISNNWASIDWQSIYFPVTMSIDYVRLYQPNDSISVTCDPSDHPTYDYIVAHETAYYNVNLTSWEAAGYTYPKNALTGNCKSSKFSG